MLSGGQMSKSSPIGPKGPKPNFSTAKTKKIGPAKAVQKQVQENKTGSREGESGQAFGTSRNFAEGSYTARQMGRAVVEAKKAAAKGDVKESDQKEITAQEFKNLATTARKNRNFVLRNLRIKDAKSSLVGINLTNFKLDNVDFNGADLSRAFFNNTKLTDVDLSKTTLKLASFDYSKQYLVSYDGAMFTQTDMGRARFDTCNFASSMHQMTKFTDAHFNDCSFHKMSASGSDFRNSHISNGKMDHSNLFRSKLDGILLSNCSITDSNLNNVRAYNATMEDNYFKDVKFKNAKFGNTKFDKSTIVATDFSGSEFTLVDFKEGCSVVDCNFSNSRLEEVSFQEASFGPVELSGANILSIDLSAAYISEDIKIDVANASQDTFIGEVKTDKDTAIIPKNKNSKEGEKKDSLQNTPELHMLFKGKESEIKIG